MVKEITLSNGLKVQLNQEDINNIADDKIEPILEKVIYLKERIEFGVEKIDIFDVINELNEVIKLC